MSVISDFEKWQQHYSAMLDGKVPLNQKVIMVNGSNPQVGKGLTIVSPSEHQDERIRALVKIQRKIKTRRKSKITHSSSKQQRRRKKSKSESSRKRKRSSSYKRK
jgi:hypothetical protein